jgi:hypothetical protein
MRRLAIQNSLKCTIIGVTEVYPKKCRFLPGKAELQLEGFDLFQSEGDEHKREVAVYINEQLTF